MECNHAALYAQLAVKFANDLVSGRFDSAHSYLSARYADEYSAQNLKSSFEEMTAYADDPPTQTSLIVTLETWPEKKTNDIGWAYVAIFGEDCSEAVTVIVELEDNNPVIRSIEWGRP